jgi:hypothetical protein
VSNGVRRRYRSEKRGKKKVGMEGDEETEGRDPQR